MSRTRRLWVGSGPSTNGPFVAPLETRGRGQVESGHPLSGAVARVAFFRELFIRNLAPYRPFTNGSSLYALIRCRIDAAGVPAGGERGPHAFRHARAVSLIRASVSLKEIGDVLGHRASDSTLVYLKLA